MKVAVIDRGTVTAWELARRGFGDELFVCPSVSCESVIERRQRLINVFGGKWTTSRSLAAAAAAITLQ